MGIDGIAQGFQIRVRVDSGYSGEVLQEQVRWELSQFFSDMDVDPDTVLVLEDPTTTEPGHFGIQIESIPVLSPNKSDS